LACKPFGTLWVVTVCHKDLTDPIEAPDARAAIEIRRLEDADVDRLIPLVIESSRAARRAPQAAAVEWAERRVRKRLEDGAICFVATGDGEIVHYNWLFPGFKWPIFLLAFANPTPFDVMMDDAYTAEQWRGKGIHAAVHARILQFARTAGYTASHTKLYTDNRSSRKALQRLGYSCYGTVIGFQARRSRRLRMIRFGRLPARRAREREGSIRANGNRGGTKIDVIDTFESFVALKAEWETVYERDAEADFFLSWQWLAEVFRASPRQWRVLAVRPDRPDSAYVCFFPIRVKHHPDTIGSDSSTEIEAAGRLSWAQYVGFVCEPEWEDRALPALARRLREMPWSRLTLKHWSSSERRIRLFLEEFPGGDYLVKHKEPPSSPGVDNLVCPYIELPDDFETYLDTCVNSNTRQEIRRFSRRIEATEKLRITVADSERFERDLEILLALWFRKWTEPRGRAEAVEVADKYRKILRQSHAIDAVMLPVLWRGATPLGALAGIVDRRRGRLYFIVAGRDESAMEPFIGLILHAFSIRWAIENGLGTYDLCHGNEPYKYSLGAADRRVAYVSIHRRPGVQPGWLDPSTVLDRTIASYQTEPPMPPT
jgi:CelD/BcsL family acetyltransferase involved in cellulose biosynthesis/GNAT superfamily N-acetyltransferase